MKRLNSGAVLTAGFIILALLLALFYFIVQFGNTQEAQRVEILPHNTYDETIVVVADIDYEPFSFVSEDGEPSGFDIELMDALANKMQVNIEFKLMNWSDCNETIQNGEADAIAGLDYRRNGYPGITLSKAVNNDSYVCFGRENFHSIGDLYGKKIAVLEQSSSITDFLEPYHLDTSMMLYSTYTEVMQSVISGENDYAIARYSVGRRILAGLGETSVRAVGPILMGNIVVVGVNEENSHLLASLNNAIDELMQDGTVDALSEKWLGSYVEIISFSDFLRVYGNILFILSEGFVILLAFVVFFLYKSKAKITQAEQEKRIKEKELELTEGRISMMLSQIKPHFLYNSLSSIAMLCEESPKAKQATKDFAVYLRGNMDSLGDNKPILFEKELRHIEVYLNLEKMRFGDRLNIAYDIQTKVFPLPALTVQPIVENAVMYSVGKNDDGGSVRISTRETEAAHLIEVSDDGVGFDPAQIPNDGRTHIGIDNVRSRLRSQCGGSLDIESKIGVGTTVTITLPKQGESAL